MAQLRVIFMGTAEVAAASLEALKAQPDFSVAAVVTQPDRPKGRHLELQPSPVKEIALREGLAILQPDRARNEDFIRELRGLQPDLIVVAEYGQILPKAILDLPRLGCINVHTSLLPKYRGAAPIQWAILNDEAETGVTIMKMDAGLDTGDILAQRATPIQPEDDSQTLHNRLGRLGAELLIGTIREYATGRIIPRPQPAEGATHARKISKEDGLLDWRLPARALWNRVRAFVPWPGAFTHLPAQPCPVLLKVWRAEPVEESGLAGEILSADKTGVVVACGEKALRILELQREGGRRMAAQEFLAGHQLRRGQKLG
ncbi:MAG TPA: methionyl-tRNA formyltransferase [Verrucomicrobiae bacterium]|nr:methionyl-tRNA formyltransferase [Verrucomicrobiae bacterium]